MMFAEMKIVRLNNDVITTSGTTGGFDFDNCDCYDSSVPGDPCNNEN